MPVPDHHRASRESGVATVWGVAWVFVCSSIGWLAVMATVIMSAQHHLDGAADLSSLSGAAGLQRGADGCATAADIARKNSAGLSDCRVEGDDVVITVTDSIDLPFGLNGGLTATARAGP